jgi:hypothetical protein
MGGIQYGATIQAGEYLRSLGRLPKSGNLGYLCGQRLKTALPQWLPWFKKHFEVNGELEKELLGSVPVKWIAG